MYSKPTLTFFPCLLYSAFLLAQNPCDTIQVVAQASATPLTCSTPFATLTGALHPTALAYAWSGPGGFSSGQRVAQNYVTGTYTLTVTGPLGCTAQTTVNVVDQCTNVPLWPPECTPPFEQVYPADYCNDVCVLPYLPGGVVYNTTGYTPGPTPLGWCSNIQNDQWFAFVAGSTSGTITAIPFNCVQENGIQMALYPDCLNALPLDCNAGQSGGGDTPITINVSNLIIGKVYYLVVDGYSGDECNFVFEVPPINPDSTVAEVDSPLTITGPLLVCPNSDFQYEILNFYSNIATAFLWTAPIGSSINGLSNYELFYKPSGQTVTINFGPVDGFVCVRPVYYFHPPGPPICFPVNNEPIPPTTLPTAVVCNEDLPYEGFYGQTVSNPGVYDLQFNEQTALGCDSLIKQRVIAKLPIVKNLGPIYRCAGDCFEINGASYCTPGNYQETLTSYQGCDSLVVFQLIFLAPVAEILGGGPLNCNQTSVSLSSTNSPGTKTWKNGNGEIVGTGNTLQVNTPGTYTLTVMQTVGALTCTQSDTITVNGQLGATLQLSADTVDCFGTMAPHVYATPVLPNAVYSWTGPHGFTAGGAQPAVGLPGTYTVIVTDTLSGCTATQSIEVTGEVASPALEVVQLPTACGDSLLLLDATSSASALQYQWTGPESFTSTVEDPVVTIPGWYQITITTTGGCAVAFNILVVGAPLIPHVEILGGTLNCVQTALVLHAETDQPPGSYTWTGPGGFTAVLAEPTISSPGEYQLLFTAANGCSATAVTEVGVDWFVPTISVEGATVLTCDHPSTTLTAASDVPDAVFTWSGNGLTVEQSSIGVTLPGIYMATATGANGCSNTLAVVVVDSCITALHDAGNSLVSGLRVYPNASRGIAFAEALGVLGFEELRIISSDGRLIWRQEFDRPTHLERLNLLDRPEGVYTVSARIGRRWWTARLILLQ